jgi:predicted nicotinamide N-methyase
VSGAPFQATQTVTRKNEQGENVRVEVPRHVRKAWFQDAAGKLYLQVRYGSKPLELAKGKNAVEVGSLSDVPAVLDAIAGAVVQGELDSQLKAAVAQRTRASAGQ